MQIFTYKNVKEFPYQFQEEVSRYLVVLVLRYLVGK